MLKIGEFSKLAKTTIKTLRFYDEIDLFKPSHVENNGYRYYSIEDLSILARIVELRELDLSIPDIKSVLNGNDLKSILTQRSLDITQEIANNKQKLSLIDNIISRIDEGDYMNKYQASIKTLPRNTVYYRHGIIKDMSKLTNFILEAGAECKENNPELKCVTPSYCYVTYEADEYQEQNVELEYAEAVEAEGKSSKNISFKVIEQTQAVCVKHIGPYEKLSEAYAFALNWVKEKGYTISDKIREVYINGCWDTSDPNNYLTEIQIPIK